MVSAELPEFVIVNTVSLLDPTKMFPKTRFPLRPMIFVEVVLAGADGDVVLFGPQAHAPHARRTENTEALTSCRRIPVPSVTET